MKSRFAYIVLVATLLAAGTALAQCRRTYIRSFPTNRKAIVALQRFVDEGHQPWRLDSDDVAGDALREVLKQGGTIYQWKWVMVASGKDQQVLRTESDSTIYYIKLVKPEYLLSNHNEDATVWVPEKLWAISCGTPVH